MSLKKIGKSILCALFEAQVKRLRAKHAFSIVAVAGSVGKTSTKLAIARTLGTKSRVRYQDGNYNDRLTVPLVLFGHVEPGLFDIPAWFKILLANERIIRRPYEFDVVVLELGTDGPEQMIKFAYLQPEIVVLTSIADEHMEYFGTLDAVAKEELATLSYAQTALLNVDDIPKKYLPSTPYKSYGFTSQSDYTVTEQVSKKLAGQELVIAYGDDEVDVIVAPLGKQGAKVVLAAVAVADQLGWTPEEIAQGVQAITAVAGRMQVLAGAGGVTLIDDTYNASPIAVKAALDVLYSAAASQRIAILGSMNELGESSQAAHQVVGTYCDATKLDYVITIGAPSNKYLAPAAEKRGCIVKNFMSPYEAGEFVKSIVKSGSVVLAKGSQNGVFAEEALKALLKHDTDAQKLVRQSAYWMRIKREQFTR